MTAVGILGEPCILGSLLGYGGMGSVYETTHPVYGRLAVKVMHVALANNPRFVERMTEEAHTAGMVDHPNVVHVVDHGRTEDDRPFIAMKYVAGAPLGASIRSNGPLELSRIIAITAQLLDGLGAIHAAGLVHADIKSDNILVAAGRRDHTTIIDFGLARAAGTRAATSGDQISGTPEYMAPEVIRGELVMPASDLYAVGVILYEMLTATTPFVGGTSSAIFDRHLDDDVVPPSLRCPERTIPFALEVAIMRALAKDPRERFRDAATFAVALENAVPAAFEDRLDHYAPVAFSTTTSTRPWVRTRARTG